MARVSRKSAVSGVTAVVDPVEPDVDEPVLTTKEEFFERWAKHKSRDDLTCYIYRLWPKIDRGRVGIESTNIEIVPGSNLDFSEAWVKRAHGSGKYRLVAVDAGNARRQWIRVIDINDPDYLPKYDPRELVLGDPKNQGEEERLRREGKLEGDDMAQDPGTTAALSGALTALVAKVGEPKPQQDFVTLNSAVDLIEKMNGPRADPLAIAKQLQELQGNGQSAFMERLLTVLIERSNPAPAIAPVVTVPGVGSLDDFLKLKKVFASLNGGGDGDSGGGVATMIQQWAPMLIPVIMRFMDRPSAPAGGFSVPQGYVLYPAPGNALAGHPGLGNGYPTAAAAEFVVNPSLPEERNGEMNAINAWSLATKALEAFERGVSGDQFADGLVTDPLGTLKGKGETLYNELAGVGRDQVLMVLKSLPVWPRLSAREKEVSTFVDDFLAYGAAPAAEPEDDPKEALQ